jgi:hypothetical protein
MTGSGGLASQNQTYGVSAEWARRAWADEARYREMYARSVSDPNGFWSEQAKRIDWIKPFTRVENCSFAPGNISIKWFEDGVLNVAWNCIDRHLEKRGEQTAIIWKGDDPNTDRTITYRQLHAEVCKFANVLRARGVTLMTGKEPSESLRKELVAWVRKDIGPIASPDLIQFAPGLPKTRSGKIMRRILRKIAEDEPGSLGDPSTLADPAVVDDLVKHRQNKRPG